MREVSPGAKQVLLTMYAAEQAGVPFDRSQVEPPLTDAEWVAAMEELVGLGFIEWGPP